MENNGLTVSTVNQAQTAEEYINLYNRLINVFLI